MADASKKVSRRLNSTSARGSNPLMKKVSEKPKPSPGSDFGSDEPLIGGDEDVPLVKEESPIKVDSSLISEDTLTGGKKFKQIIAAKSTQTMPGVDYPAKKPEAAKTAPAPAKPAASAKLPAAKPAPAAADKPKPSVSGKAPAVISKKMPAVKAKEPIEDEDDLEDPDDDADLDEAVDDGEEDEALAAKARKKKADADLWENPLEKKNDDEEEEEVEEEVEKPSNRVTRRMSAGSSRKSAASKRGSKRGEEDEPKSSKRKTVREEGVEKKGIPVKYLVLAGVVIFGALFAVVGYDPLMRHLYTSKLETGATLEERKGAADSLYHRYPDKISVPLGIFSKHIASPDPMLREAAVYGMELVGKGSPAGRADVIAQFKNDINGVDPAGKVLFINAMTGIAKVASEESKGAADEPSIKAIAAAVLPQSEPEAPADVRMAAVSSLAGLRAPGVCIQLLKLASSEKSPLKEKARSGVAPTALPDAAGELLRKMKDPDTELAKIAQDAFVRVRDAAKSDDLLPLVSDPSEEVRSKIVEALAKRAGDAKAAQGITTAMSDAKPEIRIMAVRAVPTTHAVPPTAQLTALVTDPVEEVRIANAETIAKLRDDGSKKVLLDSFKNNLQGKTMEAYITALGKRATSTVKDFESIGMVVKLFQTHPGAEKSLCEALVFLTLAGQGERRAQTRRGWDAAKWQSWWANIQERERIRKTGNEKISTAAKKKDADRSTFPQWLAMTREGLDILEKCKEMCSPDDSEDIPAIDRDIHDGTRQQDYFFKSSGVDVRSR